MTSSPGDVRSPETAVVVRYWAGARAAAGVAQDVFEVDGPVTLADVVRRVLDAHPDERTARVVGVCSVLVGDEPAGGRDFADVVVVPGSTVELLPPFAGGRGLPGVGGPPPFWSFLVLGCRGALGCARRPRGVSSGEVP